MPDNSDPIPDRSSPGEATRWRLIVRLHAGELSEREEVELRRRIDADPEWRALYEDATKVWQHTPASRRLWNAAAALQRIEGAAARLRSERRRRLFRLPASPWLRVAAGLLAIIGAAAVAHTLATRPPTDRATAGSPLSTISTRNRQRALIRFGDGTQVTVAPGSTLRYPPALSGLAPAVAREVELEGEAYFEVVHDARRPFAVRTARGVARDLGTRFIMRAYAESRTAEVVVAQGAVSLSVPRLPAGDHVGAEEGGVDSLVLTPGALGRVDAEGGLRAVARVDVEAHLAWTRGVLAFTDTPLRDVLPRFARWFDLDVGLGDESLGARTFTGAFRNETVEQAIRSLAAAVDLRAERRDRVITLVR